MTQDELKLVLEALKWCHGGEPCGTAEAIAVVEKALAQEQEPVRIMGFNCKCGRRMEVSAEQGVVPAPQRSESSGKPAAWVGLTNNDLQPIAEEYRILFGSWVHDFARAIEAKLKEKNNG